MSQTPPFRLAPYFRTRIWGFQDLAPWFDYKTDGEPIGEVWLTGEMCPAETGPFTGTSLDDITAMHSEAILGPAHKGEQFPLLIKILFPKEMLSVQVHPDDALAQKFGEPRGKTECWYALDAQPDATVALGLKPGATPEQVRQSIEDEDLEKLLEWLPVHQGDMIFVDAGTVHAIAPGSVLLETQQTSDLTYRMYDYGRGRELHVEKSMEAMRLKTAAGKVPPRKEGNRSILIDVRYFRMECYQLEGPNAGQALRAASTQPGVQLLFVAKGKATLHGAGFEPFSLNRAQLAVIPAAAGEWDIDADQPLELMRIVPQ